ncbi:hypothetical protein [Escherichia coli]|nr:hypothetical protein [Escherichia coli]
MARLPQERSGETVSPELTAGAKTPSPEEKLRTERAEDNPWITSGGWL